MRSFLVDDRDALEMPLDQREPTSSTAFPAAESIVDQLSCIGWIGPDIVHEQSILIASGRELQFSPPTAAVVALTGGGSRVPFVEGSLAA